MLGQITAKPRNALFLTKLHRLTNSRNIEPYGTIKFEKGLDQSKNKAVPTHRKT